MPDGEWTDPGLSFDTFGMGLTHMALHITPEPDCGRCSDTGQVGNPLFPVACPDCTPQATSTD